MSDKMIPLSISSVLSRLGKEKEKYNTIFQIPLSRISARDNSSSIEIMGVSSLLPLGPAAGPHTQLSQNIVTAYLCGGRYFELKTVQKMDSLEFDKPCIDARDECYNTEWSTELSLSEAFSEYAIAWITIHLLQSALFGKNQIDFIFNMSVGYDLAGIRTPKMQEFIDGMIKADKRPLWQKLLNETNDYFEQSELPVFWKPVAKNIKSVLENISPQISSSVTLSTMHGCPPQEIEAIAAYLLKEKSLHTFVKLNPTLLGYNVVTQILKGNGFDYLQLDAAAFARDLQFDDAIPMLSRLQILADSMQLDFGVKLSNTLAVKNRDDVLPGEEKYMSGRSLFPLTIRLAGEINEAFQGKMSISYSGGANAGNIIDILKSGIYPITVATDLLKPGGYLRLADMADKIEKEKIIPARQIDEVLLKKLAAESVERKSYKKLTQMPLRQYPFSTLPVFDCYEAPCISACPIKQDIPQYIELAGKGQYQKALELIFDKNPLPNITGYICDHQCEFHCTRNDYETPVAIREVKRIIAEKGKAWKEKNIQIPELRSLPKVAVIGAGPAGLSAGFFLRRNGFPVTVFERAANPGGVIGNILPDFRMSSQALAEDIEFIKALGTNFQFSVPPESITVENLKAKGFTYIFFAIGAGLGKPLPFSASPDKVIEALEFLGKYKENKAFIRPGENVLVIGGGNTAMDSSRAAKRLPGVRNVKIVYRRSLKELPADREEFEMAMEDGVEFLPNLNPLQIEDNDLMLFEKMELGPPDESGRARPVGTGKYERIPADLVVSAIGESVDVDFMLKAGVVVELPENLETAIAGVFVGGDARRGPATVVEAIADAGLFVDKICKLEKITPVSASFAKGFARPQRDDLIEKRGRMASKIESDGFEKNEARRCLHCDFVCDKCVEVCPNRANVPILSPPGFNDPFQIIHLDDLCNECGNCATFCPHDGKPYRDKLTVFSSAARFMDSNNPGFYLHSPENKSGRLRWNGEIISFASKDKRLESDHNGIPKSVCLVMESIINEHQSLVLYDRDN